MPFYLNLRIIFSLILLLILIVSAIFFFAVFAILLIPLTFLFFLFRKSILRNFFIKNFNVNTSSSYKKQNKNDFYENIDNYIEVDYEIKKEKNIKN